MKTSTSNKVRGTSVQGTQSNFDSSSLKLISNNLINAATRTKVMTRKRKTSQHPLRKFRLERNLTLEDLAELTNMSPSYLSRLESGTRRLNADILQQLSIALNCPPGSLLPYASPHLLNYTDSISGGSKEQLSNLNTSDTDAAGHDLSQQTRSDPGQQTYSCDNISGSEILTYSNVRASKVFVDANKTVKKDCNVLVIQKDQHAFVGKIVDVKKGQFADQKSVMTIEYLNSEHIREQKNFTQNNLQAVYCVVGHIEAA